MTSLDILFPPLLLRSRYGFKCVCHVCSMTGALLAEDELRRRAVRQVQEQGLDGMSLEQLEEFFHHLSMIQVRKGGEWEWN